MLSNDYESLALTDRMPNAWYALPACSASAEPLTESNRSLPWKRSPTELFAPSAQPARRGLKAGTAWRNATRHPCRRTVVQERTVNVSGACWVESVVLGR